MVWVAGHFGEWLQGRAGPDGAVALVTLACPVRGVAVAWCDDLTMTLSDPAGLIGADRAARFLTTLGLPARGTVTVTPDLPPGSGAGMSTAALVALARAAGAAEDRIAAACLAVEGAVDPLMLDAPDAVLWASRRAVALTALPPPPRAEIIGGLWGAAERTDPADDAFAAVDDLIATWSRGPDLPGAARIASLSAARSTALRGPVGDPTATLAVRLGALGWARAHTGPARALIYAPEQVPEGVEAALRETGYTHVLRFATGGRA
ncbi:threonine kinase [Loktanella fryxellensis]|uniref:Threonine kinase n=1 Tax=Loktanella fryxellensis TaxID=245187 RepID=A0A1H8C8H8_9RHOB|nr:hypothetical protein [Loktanella fryxellensis]SEM91521.1 threonine kinase [Loktanella fryxellensis]